jgi:hypothetical protein
MLTMKDIAYIVLGLLVLFVPVALGVVNVILSSISRFIFQEPGCRELELVFLICGFLQIAPCVILLSLGRKASDDDVGRAFLLFAVCPFLYAAVSHQVPFITFQPLCEWALFMFAALSYIPVVLLASFSMLIISARLYY